MKTILLVLAFALALGLPGASYAQKASAAHLAADVWHSDFDRVLGMPNRATWTAPGNALTIVSRTNGTLFSAPTAGQIAANRSDFARLLGQPMAISDTRIADYAGVVLGITKLGSVIGIASLLIDGVPALAEWVAGDNAQHIRVGADGKSLEKNGALCSVDCYFYHTTGWGPAHDLILFDNQASACASIGGEISGWGCTSIYGYISLQRITRSPDVANWLPASMDDIAPYLTPRNPPATLLPQLLDAGGEVIPISNAVTVTGLPPVIEPTVITTPYPSVTEDSTVKVPGNPLGLAPNTPTEISRGSRTRLVPPGTSSVTGPAPDPASNPGPLPSPETTIETGTFDPADGPAGSTTRRTVGSTDRLTRTEVRTPTVTVPSPGPTTGDGPGPTVTGTTTNIWNEYIKNEVTNITTTTIINNPPPPPPPPPPSQKQSPLCELFPDILACAKLGDPPASPPLPKTDHPVAITPVPFGGSGSCPPPVVWTAYGVHEFSYQPLCDKLIYLKVLFLAIAGLLASYILADSFKVT